MAGASQFIGGASEGCAGRDAQRDRRDACPTHFREKSRNRQRIEMRPLWQRNSQKLTRGSGGTLFYFSMPRDGRNFTVAGIFPNRMRAMVSGHKTAMAAKMPLQINELHTAASSIGSRTAPGAEELRDSDR